MIAVNGRLVMVNGRLVTIAQSRSLVFSVEGDRFPFSVYPRPTINPGRMDIRSSTANEITINYGDGIVITYPFYYSGGGFGYRAEFNSNQVSQSTYIMPYHEYEDSFTGVREISISFSRPETIYFMNFNFMNLFKSFPRNIDALSGLNNLGIRISQLTSFPDTMNKLMELELLNLNDIGTAISERIPDSILQTNIKILTVSSSVNLRDVYASNFFALCVNLGGTLENLDVNGTNILTLPDNFSNLTVLKIVRLAGLNVFTTLPPEVNEVPSLELLRVGVYQGLDKLEVFGSLGNLINLKTIECYRSTTLHQFIPDDFENCVKFKTYQFGGGFQTQARIDRLVNEMYAFITANASMAVGNTKFRQMAITTFISGTPSPSPTGTYQQPTGYTQGSNNGDPQTPMEKIWVLVNQYQTTWTY